jgi:sugar/nucleoside kinase (ribokinase family)
MSILVVGSVALDSIETPFGRAERVLGGSAVFFSAAASLFGKVHVVGVVGEDYPLSQLSFLEQRGADLAGIEQRPGESFFWAGRYAFDLNTRETLETRLGVFAHFRPAIPERCRGSRFVFLGNIDPRLQMEVLAQVSSPELVVCDTMNYWITGSREALLELLGRVDVLLVNDAEARQLSGEFNLLRAARWIQRYGPEYVVVKKGEHGAILFAPQWMFFAPGYPLEEVYDPTGAGDAFAGGFMGYLSGCGTVDREELKRAVIYGCATGSYAVERFGVERFRELTSGEVARRVEEFREMTFFEHELERVRGV